MNLNKVFIKIFGSRNERLLKHYWRAVARVNEMEPQVSAMTDEQLQQRTLEIHEGLMDGSLTRTEMMPESLAIIREAMDRNIGLRTVFATETGEFTIKFDPGQLDAEARKLYDQVQQQVAAGGSRI